MAVLMSKQMVIPSTGKLASDYAVGESVFLNVNGTKTEFLIVHQGKPSSLYDNSCDGTWLLAKECYSDQKWRASGSNVYASSDVHTYLNGTFFDLLDNSVRSAIKQVKIPHGAGGTGRTVYSGTDGLSTKVFLLSCIELGWTQSSLQYAPVDGACLDYFSGTNETDSRRIADYLPDPGGTNPWNWYTRTPYCRSNYTKYVYFVTKTGGWERISSIQSYGIRPALILPNNAMFDSDTNEFKGV